MNNLVHNVQDTIQHYLTYKEKTGKDYPFSRDKTGVNNPKMYQMLKSACEDFKVAVTVPSEVKENTLEMNKKAR